MSFTPEQIQAITEIVDRKINELEGRSRDTQSQAKTKHVRKPYHTVQELRLMIVKHEAKLREEFGDRMFDIAVLRHELAKLTTLREGDLELTGDGDPLSSQRRWEHQVLNAIKVRDWPGCPIERGAVRGTYRFIPQTCYPLLDPFQET